MPADNIIVIIPILTSERLSKEMKFCVQLFRWLLAISLQVNAVLEEMLGWRASYLRTDSIVQKDASTVELLRPPTRFSILSEQTIIKLSNSRICPVAAWIVVSTKADQAVRAGKSCIFCCITV